ncbi:16581_t:CDS:2, partial [Racocetra persica]
YEKRSWPVVIDLVLQNTIFCILDQEDKQEALHHLTSFNSKPLLPLLKHQEIQHHQIPDHLFHNLYLILHQNN